MKRLPVTKSSRPSPLRSTSVEAWPCDQALSIIRRVHLPPSPCSNQKTPIVVAGGGDDVVAAVAVDVERRG